MTGPCICGHARDRHGPACEFVDAIGRACPCERFEDVLAAGARAILGPGATFVREADALAQIARILEPFEPQDACEIMAAVAAIGGHHEEAARFIELAKQHAEANRGR